MKTLLSSVAVVALLTFAPSANAQCGVVAGSSFQFQSMVVPQTVLVPQVVGLQSQFAFNQVGVGGFGGLGINAGFGFGARRFGAFGINNGLFLNNGIGFGGVGLGFNFGGRGLGFGGRGFGGGFRFRR